MRTDNITARKIWVKKGTIEVLDDIGAYAKDDIEQITQNALKQRKANRKKIWVKKGTDEIIDVANIESYSRDSIEEITKTALRKRKKVWIEKGTYEVIDNTKLSEYSKDVIEEITLATLSERKRNSRKVLVKIGSDEVIGDAKMDVYPKDDVEEITPNALRSRKRKLWVMKGTDEIIDEVNISTYPKDSIEKISKTTLQNRRSKKVWVKKGSDEVIDEGNVSAYPKNAIEQITLNALNIRKKKVWVKKDTNEVIDSGDISSYHKDDLEEITQSQLYYRKRKKVWVKKGSDEVIDDAEINQYPKEDLEEITLSTFYQRKKKIWVKIGSDEVIDNDKISMYDIRDIEAISQSALCKRKKKVWVKKGTNEIIEEDSLDNFAEDEIEQISQNALNARQHRQSKKRNLKSQLISPKHKKNKSELIPIKQDPIPVNVAEVIIKLRDILLHKRKGNNCQDNCGHTTKYTLLALEALLHGKEPPLEEISTETSGVDTTATQITYGYFNLKDESGEKVRKQLRTVSSIALPTKEGLHSILPPRVSPYILLETISPETLIFDLEESNIPAIPTTIRKINEDLKLEALKANGIVIGQVVFAKLGKKTVGHVITFSATENEVFFIDAHLIDGNNVDHPGDPIFNSLLDNSNYEFATPLDLAPSKEAFGDNCFYLVHKTIPNIILQNRDSIKRLYTSSSSSFFKPGGLSFTPTEVSPMDYMEHEAHDLYIDMN